MEQEGRQLGESSYIWYEKKKGGMGEVYICGDLSSEDRRPEYALKSFKKEFFFNSVGRAAFLREASLWARLSGLPGIMPVLHIDMIDDRPFIVMPAVMGNKSTLRDHISFGDKCSISFILEVLFQVSFGLNEAEHELPGIVHGDLKPENILVSTDIMIADFGLANIPGELLKEPDRILKSTAAYRAPELWDPAKQMTQSSDIYSIGIILYELFTGKWPFYGRDESDWSSIHKEVKVKIPVDQKVSALEKEIIRIANKCLEKNPASRFRDYCALYDAVLKSTDKLQKFDRIMFLNRVAERVTYYRKMRKMLHGPIVQSLNQLNEHNLALEHLDGLDSKTFDEHLWFAYGTTLSLKNQEDDAISAFNETLAKCAVEDVELKFRILIEIALSHKRLGEYDKSIQEFKELLILVPDNLVPNVVINLSSVYFQQHRYVKGIELLEGHIHNFSDNAIAWKSLGGHYLYRFNIQHAIRCFGRSLELDITDASVQCFLGIAYFIGDRIPNAVSSFDLALHQGYSTSQLVSHLIACEILMNHEHEVQELITMLNRDTSVDTTNAVLEEVEQLVSWYKVRFKGRKEILYPFFPPEELEQEKKSPTADNTIQQETGFKMPFLNTRFYMQENMYSIDFYYDIHSADYPVKCQEFYNVATREMHSTVGKTANFRGTPLFFTRCRGCGLIILTNWDIYKTIKCCNCDTPNSSEPIKGDQHLDDLLNKVNEVIGRTLIKKENVSSILIVQDSDPGKLRNIVDDCTESGFELLDEKLLIGIKYFHEGVKSGIFNFNDPYFAFLLLSLSENFYEDRGAPEIELLIRKLRKKYKQVKTLSATLDTTEYGNDSPETLMLWGHFEELESKIEKIISAGPWQSGNFLMLSVAQIELGKIREARKVIDMLILETTRQYFENEEMAAIYMAKANIEKDHFSVDQAIKYYAKCYEMDPVNKRALKGLINCYDRKGNKQKAQHYYVLLKALGDTG